MSVVQGSQEEGRAGGGSVTDDCHTANGGDADGLHAWEGGEEVVDQGFLGGAAQIGYPEATGDDGGAWWRIGRRRRRVGDGERKGGGGEVGGRGGGWGVGGRGGGGGRRRDDTELRGDPG
eukprot:evm.model.NODE_19065_length_7578_cov_30.316574.2